MLYEYIFFFKQKTAYEMRISDWSSDVCSSDLDGRHDRERSAAGRAQASAAGIPAGRHDQHPVHRGRRVQRARKDHRRPPAGQVDRLRRACRRPRRTPQRRSAQANRTRGSAEVRARSEERRVGKGCVSTLRAGWSPEHEKKKEKKKKE